MTAKVSQSGEPRDGSGAMFDLIADRYDLANRIISLGIDQRWRRKTIAAMGIRPGDRILDVATGTADLALAVAGEHPASTVVGLDPSVEMLRIGREKVAAGTRSVELVEGDAQELPFEDASFDGICMGFGIRNVPDRGKALRELARVLRPGRRLAILELGEPRSGALSTLARFHIHQVVPRVGAWLSGQPAYAYLARSIEAFPEPHVFASMLRDAGLRPHEPVALSFGVAHLYVAEKPRATPSEQIPEPAAE